MIGPPSGDDLISIVKARYPDLESLVDRLIGRGGLYGFSCWLSFLFSL